VVKACGELWLGSGLEQGVQLAARQQAAVASIGAGTWSNGAGKWRTWPAAAEASRLGGREVTAAPLDV
jgi:hypothetical protein